MGGLVSLLNPIDKLHGLNQAETLNIPVGTELANSIELAKWSFPNVADLYPHLDLWGTQIAGLARSSGVQDCVLALDHSADDITWVSLSTGLAGGGIIAPNFQEIVRMGQLLSIDFTSFPGTKYIRFAARMNGAIDSGIVKDLSCWFRWWTPPGYELTRII